MNTKIIIASSALLLSIFASAQVGIGTQNPQGIFNIDGGKDNETTGTPSAAKQLNDFTVLGNGNVGIGTTNPSQKLEIISPSTDILTGGMTARIFNPTLGKDYFAGTQYKSGGNSSWKIGVNQDSATATDQSFYFLNSYSGASFAPKMMIQSNTGNVGIGTTAPQDLGHIYKITGAGSGTNAGGLIIETDNPSGNISHQASISLRKKIATGPIDQNGNAIYFDGIFNGTNGNYAGIKTFLNASSTTVSDVSVNITARGGMNYADPTTGTVNTIATFRGNGNVGIGITAPNSSALLDVSSTTKGFLPPRLTKLQRDAITTPATGLVLYCTDCNNGAGCLQTNDGTPTTPNWNCIGIAPAASVSGTCTGFSGSLQVGTALNASNTYNVTFTNNSFSPISVNFGTADLSFEGASSGTISVASVSPTTVTNLAAGASQVITYTLTGTPLVNGTITAKWNKIALNCSSTTTIGYSLPTFNCNRQSIVSNSYTLINGTSYTGTLSIPYTGGTTGDSYPMEVISQQGISLTRNAGNYATTGTINYTLSGTFNGTSNSVLTFTTDAKAGGCTIVLFDAIRQAIITGGNTSDLTNYDNTTANGVIGISSASYNAIAVMTGAGKILCSDSLLNTTTSNGTAGQNATQAFNPNAFDAAYFTGGRYMVAFAIRSKSALIIEPAANYQNMIVKFSSNATSGFTDYTAPFSSVAAGNNVIKYFVIKKPSNAIPSTPVLAIYNPHNNNDLIGCMNDTTTAQYSLGNSSTLNFTHSVNIKVNMQAIEVLNKQW